MTIKACNDLSSYNLYKGVAVCAVDSSVEAVFANFQQNIAAINPLPGMFIHNNNNIAILSIDKLLNLERELGTPSQKYEISK